MTTQSKPPILSIIKCRQRCPKRLPSISQGALTITLGAVSLNYKLSASGLANILKGVLVVIKGNSDLFHETVKKQSFLDTACGEIYDDLIEKGILHKIDDDNARLAITKKNELHHRLQYLEGDQKDRILPILEASFSKYAEFMSGIEPIISELDDIGSAGSLMQASSSNNLDGLFIIGLSLIYAFFNILQEKTCGRKNNLQKIIEEMLGQQTFRELVGLPRNAIAVALASLVKGDPNNAIPNGLVQGLRSFIGSTSPLAPHLISNCFSPPIRAAADGEKLLKALKLAKEVYAALEEIEKGATEAKSNLEKAIANAKELLKLLQDLGSVAAVETLELKEAVEELEKKEQSALDAAEALDAEAAERAETEKLEARLNLKKAVKAVIEAREVVAAEGSGGAPAADAAETGAEAAGAGDGTAAANAAEEVLNSPLPQTPPSDVGAAALDTPKLPADEHSPFAAKGAGEGGGLSVSSVELEELRRVPAVPYDGVGTALKEAKDSTAPVPVIPPPIQAAGDTAPTAALDTPKLPADEHSPFAAKGAGEGGGLSVSSVELEELRRVPAVPYDGVGTALKEAKDSTAPVPVIPPPIQAAGDTAPTAALDTPKLPADEHSPFAAKGAGEGGGLSVSSVELEELRRVPAVPYDGVGTALKEAKDSTAPVPVIPPPIQAAGDTAPTAAPAINTAHNVFDIFSLPTLPTLPELPTLPSLSCVTQPQPTASLPTWNDDGETKNPTNNQNTLLGL